MTVHTRIDHQGIVHDEWKERLDKVSSSVEGLSGDLELRASRKGVKVLSGEKVVYQEMANHGSNTFTGRERLDIVDYVNYGLKGRGYRASLPVRFLIGVGYIPERIKFKKKGK